jgi:hypothetical protein
MGGPSIDSISVHHASQPPRGTLGIEEAQRGIAAVHAVQHESKSGDEFSLKSVAGIIENLTSEGASDHVKR